jgi:hypothetical protein
MNIYDLFNKGGDTSRGLKQAVIVHFTYGHKGLEPLRELESKLRILLFHEGTGELDSHAIAMDNAEGSLYFYGPNAEALFKSVRPLLLETPFMKKATVYLRFGAVDDPTVSDIEFMLE